MAKILMLAINRIHRTVTPGKKATATEAAVAPKQDIVRPGNVFEAVNADERNELRDAGAARVLTDDETKVAKVGLPLYSLATGRIIEGANVTAARSAQMRRETTAGGGANPPPGQAPASSGPVGGVALGTNTGSTDNATSTAATGRAGKTNPPAGTKLASGEGSGESGQEAAAGTGPTGDGKTGDDTSDLV